MLYLYKNYFLFILGWEKSNSDHQYLARSGKTKSLVIIKQSVSFA